MPTMQNALLQPEDSKRLADELIDIAHRLRLEVEHAIAIENKDLSFADALIARVDDSISEAVSRAVQNSLRGNLTEPFGDCVIDLIERGIAEANRHVHNQLLTSLTIGNDKRLGQAILQQVQSALFDALQPDRDDDGPTLAGAISESVRSAVVQALETCIGSKEFGDIAAKAIEDGIARSKE